MMPLRPVRLMTIVCAVTACAVQPAWATFHLMQVEQVIGGVNGDTAAQAIQLRTRSFGQNLLAGSRIRVFDADGMNPIVVIDFTASVPGNGAGARVLVATPEFLAATAPAATADVMLTSLIPDSYLDGGCLTFENNTGSIVYWRLSWGSYAGPTTGALDNDDDGDFGAPFPGPLPSTCARAVQFQGPFSAESTTNARDYALTSGPATFTNNSGQSYTVLEQPDHCCDASECDDGVACTDDTCVLGTCASTPNDANCPDNGLFCDGLEACDPLLDCVATPPCGAGEVCDEQRDLCVADALDIVLETVVDGLVAPIDLTHAGDGSGRLFIVEQSGQIRIVDAAGTLLPTPFLDISDRLVDLSDFFDERGLLGMAFHPDYASNGRFFVRYSAPRPGRPEESCNDPDGFIVGCHSEVLAEFSVSGDDPDVADPDSEIILFTAEEPQFNHNSGQVGFGPDGMLYFTLGDGGGANDGLADLPPSHGPTGNGQNTQTALGSLLRIDVDSMPAPGLDYAIPADNPFADGLDGLPEIYAYGLRNPFKFSWDDGPGGDQALYLADVGQGLVEEVNIVNNGGNYGWVIREGTLCFDPLDTTNPPPACATTGPFGEPLLDPISEYYHGVPCVIDDDCAFLGVACDDSGLCANEGGIAIVGGYVYRGSTFPELVGHYVYGDFSDDFLVPGGRLYYFETSGPNAFQRVQFDIAPNNGPLGLFLKGFGEDAAGEIYVLASAALAPFGTDGVVLRIARPCASVADCADLDGNDIRDDGCIFWSCEDMHCAATEVSFADMGGQFGECPPDGTADGNDRFHALNCFANADAGGGPYSCEDAPPAAFNVDAGGQFGDCAPDGVCDGNDAFHALNVFGGLSSCACPLDGGPAPAFEPTVVATAALALIPDRATARPGATIDIDVYLDTPLRDLRGYQLHLGVEGGSSGTLRLADITTSPKTSTVLAAADWSAYNTATGQVVVGLDGPGVAVDAGYLATFTYHVPRDASGEFVIRLLHDDGDASQRTFLFPTLPGNRIVITETAPAVISVRGPARNAGR